MQREMDYRKKLEIKGSAQWPQSQLLEVPRPTPRQDTRGTPRPTLNLNMNSAYLPQNHGSVPPARPPPPYPYPPHPRPSPYSGPSRSADQWRNGPVPLPEGIFTCKVCQLDCKTGFNLLSHHQGQKHKAKVQGQKGKEVAGGSTPRENEKRPYCDVCRIWCADEYTFRLHFSCTNHILRQYDWLMKKRMVRQLLLSNNAILGQVRGGLTKCLSFIILS